MFNTPLVTEQELRHLLHESMPRHHDLALVLDDDRETPNHLAVLFALRIRQVDTPYSVINIKVLPETSGDEPVEQVSVLVDSPDVFRNSLYFILDDQSWPGFKNLGLVETEAQKEIERVLEELQNWRHKAASVRTHIFLEEQILARVQHVRQGHAIYSAFDTPDIGKSSIFGEVVDWVYGFAEEAAILTKPAKTGSFGPFRPVTHADGSTRSLIPNVFIPPPDTQIQQIPAPH